MKEYPWELMFWTIYLLDALFAYFIVIDKQKPESYLNLLNIITAVLWPIFLIYGLVELMIDKRVSKSLQNKNENGNNKEQQQQPESAAGKKHPALFVDIEAEEFDPEEEESDTEKIGAGSRKIIDLPDGRRKPGGTII